VFDYESFPRFKAAAVQAGMVLRDPPQWFDMKASLEKAVSLIEEAGRNGARLIVFPESWLPGHPHVVLSMGASVLRDNRDVWVQYLKHSIEVPGPEVETLGKAARKAGAYVVMGINERDSKHYGKMYNSILFLGPQGEVLGTHRKISNTVTERLFHSPGPGGDNLRTVFDTELGRLGGSICCEHSQYLLQYYWVLQGMEVNCSLWPGLPIPMQIRVRGVSLFSSVFSVAACPYLPMEDYPPGFRAREERNPLCGGSSICGPDGEYIVDPVFDKETIVYGELDLAQIPERRAAVNLTGLYSRWDILSLNVRDELFEPVHIIKPGESDRDSDLLDRIAALERAIGGSEALQQSSISKGRGSSARLRKPSG
jgi:predicted amidohydrolase